MKRKINMRLGLISFVAIFMTLLGITLVFDGLFQKNIRENLRQSTWLLAATGVFDRPCQGEAFLKELGDLPSQGLRVTWIGEDGRVLYDNEADPRGMPNHGDRQEVRDAIGRGEGESVRRSDTLRRVTFYYAGRLENGTVLRLSTKGEAFFGLLISALPVIGGIMAIILMGCVLMGHFLTEGLMRPLEEMAEHLEGGGGVPLYKELEPFAQKIRSQHENILAAAQSRQDFTANISHELKTPITAISGYAELIENHLIDARSEEHIARQIRHNADRLLSLITDIIRLSELDHQELPRTFESMDLFALAKECVEELRPFGEGQGVQLYCRGMGASLVGDPSLVRELMDNLVQNSIRYNREGGEVLVEVAVILGHPTLFVTDTGIGIPSDQLERVFERFFRVDKSRSRATGGTGLGLAIVKHIAQIHGAQIQIHSQVGEGTQISVRF